MGTSKKKSVHRKQNQTQLDRTNDSFDVFDAEDHLT
jgi:hypothetical protein